MLSYTKKLYKMPISKYNFCGDFQARIQRGGARPPVFASNSLKSPLNSTEYAQKLAPEPHAPPPSSNPGSSPDFLFFI